MRGGKGAGPHGCLRRPPRPAPAPRAPAPRAPGRGRGRPARRLRRRRLRLRIGARGGRGRRVGPALRAERGRRGREPSGRPRQPPPPPGPRRPTLSPRLSRIPAALSLRFHSPRQPALSPAAISHLLPPLLTPPPRASALPVGCVRRNPHADHRTVDVAAAVSTAKRRPGRVLSRLHAGSGSAATLRLALPGPWAWAPRLSAVRVFGSPSEPRQAQPAGSPGGGWEAGAHAPRAAGAQMRTSPFQQEGRQWALF